MAFIAVSGSYVRCLWRRLVNRVHTIPGSNKLTQKLHGVSLTVREVAEAIAFRLEGLLAYGIKSAIA